MRPKQSTLEAVRTFVLDMGHYSMGQATRTTKQLLDMGNQTQGGANTDKRAALDATARLLPQARAFYIDFFLAHSDKLAEHVSYCVEQHLQMRELAISAMEARRERLLSSYAGRQLITHAPKRIRRDKQWNHREKSSTLS